MAAGTTKLPGEGSFQAEERDGGWRGRLHRRGLMRQRQREDDSKDRKKRNGLLRWRNLERRKGGNCSRLAAALIQQPARIGISVFAYLRISVRVRMLCPVLCLSCRADMAHLLYSALYLIALAHTKSLFPPWTAVSTLDREP